jgi:hypothetical protein
MIDAFEEALKLNELSSVSALTEPEKSSPF